MGYRKTCRNRNLDCRQWLVDAFRKQEAQLPQGNSAPHGGGLGPQAYSPSVPSGYTYAYGRIRNPQQTYVKRAVN